MDAWVAAATDGVAALSRDADLPNEAAGSLSDGGDGVRTLQVHVELAVRLQEARMPRDCARPWGAVEATETLGEMLASEAGQVQAVHQLVAARVLQRWVKFESVDSELKAWSSLFVFGSPFVGRGDVWAELPFEDLLARASKEAKTWFLLTLVADLKGGRQSPDEEGQAKSIQVLANVLEMDAIELHPDLLRRIVNAVLTTNARGRVLLLPQLLQRCSDEIHGDTLLVDIFETFGTFSSLGAALDMLLSLIASCRNDAALEARFLPAIANPLSLRFWEPVKQALDSPLDDLMHVQGLFLLRKAVPFVPDRRSLDQYIKAEDLLRNSDTAELKRAWKPITACASHAASSGDWTWALRLLKHAMSHHNPEFVVFVCVGFMKQALASPAWLVPGPAFVFSHVLSRATLLQLDKDGQQQLLQDFVLAVVAQSGGDAPSKALEHALRELCAWDTMPVAQNILAVLSASMLPELHVEMHATLITACFDCLDYLHSCTAVAVARPAIKTAIATAEKTLATCTRLPSTVGDFEMLTLLSRFLERFQDKALAQAWLLQDADALQSWCAAISERIESLSICVPWIVVLKEDGLGLFDALVNAWRKAEDQSGKADQGKSIVAILNARPFSCIHHAFTESSSSLEFLDWAKTHGDHSVLLAFARLLPQASEDFAARFRPSWDDVFLAAAAEGRWDVLETLNQAAIAAPAAAAAAKSWIGSWDPNAFTQHNSLRAILNEGGAVSSDVSDFCELLVQAPGLSERTLRELCNACENLGPAWVGRLWEACSRVDGSEQMVLASLFQPWALKDEAIREEHLRGIWRDRVEVRGEAFLVYHLFLNVLQFQPELTSHWVDELIFILVTSHEKDVALEVMDSRYIDLGSLQMVRLTILSFLQRNIKSLGKQGWAWSLFDRILRGQLVEQRFPNHQHKLVWQVLALLSPKFVDAIEQRDAFLEMLLGVDFEQFQFRMVARYYMELALTNVVLTDPVNYIGKLLAILQGHELPIEKAMSCAMAIGIAVHWVSEQELAEAPGLAEEIKTVFLTHISAPNVQTREVSQWVLHSVVSSDDQWRQDQGLGNMLEFISLGKQTSRGRQRYDKRFGVSSPAVKAQVSEIVTSCVVAKQARLVNAWLDAGKILPGDDFSVDLAAGGPNATSPRPTHAAVVAGSLVTKIPNVAGLIRTCERFAMRRVAIQQRKFMNDRGFPGIVASAQRWMDIEEVSFEDTPDYLGQVRAEGYRIVALEQSANSEMIQSYSFPRDGKVCFLLGMEREGVPIHLLNLVDDCIEIPQLGFTRSLNVHASATILIWEYLKQCSPT